MRTVDWVERTEPEGDTARMLNFAGEVTSASSTRRFLGSIGARDEGRTAKVKEGVGEEGSGVDLVAAAVRVVVMVGAGFGVGFMSLSHFRFVEKSMADVDTGGCRGLVKNIAGWGFDEEYRRLRAI